MVLTIEGAYRAMSLDIHADISEIKIRFYEIRNRLLAEMNLLDDEDDRALYQREIALLTEAYKVLTKRAA